MLGTLSVVFIGGSVAAASLLQSYPLLGGQALRFAVAAVVLFAYGLMSRHRFRLPTGREWVWLMLLALCGMSGYGVMLVHATSVTEPGNVGVAIGAAPLCIVLVRSLQTRSKPGVRLVVGAAIVLAGTAVAQVSANGGLQWSLEGLFWSFAVLLGAASITLVGAPVVATLGPYSVTTYGCTIAAVILLGTSAGIQAVTGAVMLRLTNSTELGALAFLAVGVTVLTMLLWYGAMSRLGAARTGLFSGLVPFASLFSVVIVGTGTITHVQLIGAGLVLIGVLIGLSSRQWPTLVDGRDDRRELVAQRHEALDGQPQSTDDCGRHA